MRYVVRWSPAPIAFAAGLIVALSGSLYAQQPTRCFSLEFFYDSAVDDASDLRTAFEEFAERRSGLKIFFRDVKDHEENGKRVAEIAKYFGMPELKLPAVYGLKNVLADLQSAAQMRSRLEEILTVTAYVREGCPHCRAVKAFLDKTAPRYPGITVVYKDVVNHSKYHDEMMSVTRRYRQQAASLPVVHFCNGLNVGFDREATTGQRMLQTLDYWSVDCPAKKK